jgi:glucokinase
MTVLAGDIGGTNTRLAIYDVITAGATDAQRPALMPLFERTYPSAAHASLDVIAEAFLGEARGAIGVGAKVASACFGIAGPIENNMCRATNLPWVVDGRALSVRLGIERVTLVNDFYAAALGVTAVGADDLVSLGGGPPASARLSCCGRRRRTATRWSPPREATWISPRARRSSRGWSSS